MQTIITKGCIHEYSLKEMKNPLSRNIKLHSCTMEIYNGNRDICIHIYLIIN